MGRKRSVVSVELVERVRVVWAVGRREMDVTRVLRRMVMESFWSSDSAVAEMWGGREFSRTMLVAMICGVC